MKKAGRVSRFSKESSKDLSILRNLWKKKKITKEEIQKLVDDNWATPTDCLFRGKKLFDLVTNMTDDIGSSEEDIFGQRVDFALYYDLEADQMIGPLALGGLDGKDIEQDEDRDHYHRRRSDAQKIREFNKDPTKIHIYSK